MANPDWGTKRTCQGCGARFYDLKRDPIICPKCEAVFDPLANLRPRRARPAAAPVEEKKAKAPVAVPVVDDSDGDDDLDLNNSIAGDDDGLEDIDDDDEEEDLIEDASELGDDDVSDVSVGADDDDDR